MIRSIVSHFSRTPVRSNLKILLWKTELIYWAVESKATVKLSSE